MPSPRSLESTTSPLNRSVNPTQLAGSFDVFCGSPFKGLSLQKDRTDRLPQPYRLLNKIVGEILENVGDEIFSIESRKKQSIMEYKLAEHAPTSTLHVSGRALCASSMKAGLLPKPDLDSVSPQLAVCGSELGGVSLLDVSKDNAHVLDSQLLFGAEVVSVPDEAATEAAKKRAAEEAEANGDENLDPEVEVVMKDISVYEEVAFVQMACGGYRRRVEHELEGLRRFRKAAPKVVVCGKNTPSLFVYTVATEKLTSCSSMSSGKLVPFGRIKMGKEDDNSGGEGWERVEKIKSREKFFYGLESWAASGALYTAALCKDRTISIFRTSLGPSVEEAEDKASEVKTILEEDDSASKSGNRSSQVVSEGENLAFVGPNSAVWDALPTVCTALYRYELPSFRLFDGLFFSEPTGTSGDPETGTVSLDSVQFHFFFAGGEKRDPNPGTPGSLLTWSKESRCVYYAKVLPIVAENLSGMTVEALSHCELGEPEEIEEATQTREGSWNKRWFQLDEISAMGVSSSGTYFAMGTKGGYFGEL